MKSTEADLLIFHLLYGFFGSLDVVFFHEGVHGGQLDLPSEVSVHTAVGHCSVLEII